MRFDEILERNRRFAAEREPRPLPPPSPVSLLVVSCFDPRLRELMAPALGIDDTSSSILWFRTAGAFVAKDSATVRALLVKIFLFDVPAVLVVGHSSCRMASFDSEEFIESFRRRGVRREAFGEADLREWAGAIPSPRRGVELTVENILSEPACPPDLSVHGAVLDDTTGVLKPVQRSNVATISKGEASSDAVEDSESREGPPTGTAPGSGPGSAREGALVSVDEMARLLRSSANWRYELGRLRKEIARATEPAAKLRLLGEFVERVGGDSREAVDAYQRFLQAARTERDGTVDPGAILRQLERLVSKL